jgi:serine O-acetyltransferase
MINAISFYRLANWLWRHNIPLLPRIIKLIIFLLYNSSVPYECTIGAGSFFGYGGIGVVLHRRSQIGRDVVIGTGTTIGGRSGSEGVPRIGSHVYIASGAKILGAIEIGDYVIIGANAVVLYSVPPGSIVAGVPAKIIKSGITPEKYSKMT